MLNATGSTLEAEEDPTQPILPGSKINFCSLRNGNLLVGPRLASDGEITVNTIGVNGTATGKPTRYVVSKTGVLIPKLGESEGESNRNVLKSRESTFYVKGFKGILIPIDLLYSKSKQKAIIDSEALEAKHRLEDVHPKKNGKKAGKVEEKNPPKSGFRPKTPNWSGSVGRLSPDKNCNGEITMFLLKNDGLLQRMPPDPYLPMGIQLSYTVKDNFLIRPRLLETSDDFVVNYSTGKNGDLVPHEDNKLKLRTEEGDLVSFILGECGTLIPVEEERGSDEEINYYYNGQLIHKGQQFPDIFSNSKVVVINDEKHNLPRKEEVKEKKHSIRKRALYADDYIVNPTQTRFYTSIGHSPIITMKPPTQTIVRQSAVVPVDPIISSPTQTVLVNSRPSPPRHQIYEEPYPPPVSSAEIAIRPQSVPIRHELPHGSECDDDHHVSNVPPRIHVRTDLFAIDEKGIKIPLIPEVTEDNDIVLYKLTCKGNLVRYPSCKEPEFGFPIHFQLLLDEFIMVPVTKNNRPLHITYNLQENGDLVPLESNENTFKKAPGSLIYFILGKNNVLFPVQQKVDPHDGSVTFYYQDYHLLKLPSTSNKPLHFSTINRPLFAFFNGLTIITTSSKPRLNPNRGSNWKNLTPKPKDPGTSRDIFLSGPNGELIRISPFRTRSGSTVIYEMDSNGILYRSPKDKKRCIILKSYILLKEGILLPSNDTTGYMYMTSKNGDMFPYLYPDGKLEAPRSESVKYLLCEKGILLPMELEIMDDHICYFFRDVIVYKERIYSKDALPEKEFKLHFRTDCDSSMRHNDKHYKSEVKPYTTPAGVPVYYEKHNTLLKRHPQDTVPPYLTYTMGSFEIQPDGSLVQIRYQDPDEDVINLMLEPNGDLLEDSRNERKPEFDYYILDVKGNLISVEARKTRKNIYFYKNNRKVCKARLPHVRMKEIMYPRVDPKRTPLGRDPLKLMDDPEPSRLGQDDDEPQSMYIPVPLKSTAMPGLTEKKCGKESTMALELEINDEVIEEIRNWAARCDKLLSRREVEKSLADALQGLNVAGLFNQGAETR
ncbi:UNVERIFIED_CONTAM: hypothetical protein PYX00_009094 [Menopon gallinae]|uniref:Uncharacterized protein n=1 Tax=Menopon gallinae TaxID=328185 RepID=A0AAW2H9R8_9NEOP